MTENLEILQPPSRFRGFLNFNIGHVIILVTWLISAVLIYSKMENRLEGLEAAVIVLKADDDQSKLKSTSVDVTLATMAQSLSDLQKSYNDDLSRRLSKLEDRMDGGK